MEPNPTQYPIVAKFHYRDQGRGSAGKSKGGQKGGSILKRRRLDAVNRESNVSNSRHVRRAQLAPTTKYDHFRLHSFRFCPPFPSCPSLFPRSYLFRRTSASPVATRTARCSVTCQQLRGLFSSVEIKPNDASRAQDSRPDTN